MFAMIKEIPSSCNLFFIGIERTLEKCSDVVYDYAYDDLSDAIEAEVNFWHHEKEDFERSEEACLPENRREMSKFDFIIDWQDWADHKSNPKFKFSKIDAQRVLMTHFTFLLQTKFK